MKNYLNILMLTLFTSITMNGQSSNWVTKENGILKYSYPSDWIESEYLEVNGNVSYGAQFYDVGVTAQLSIMETPNESGLTNAHQISDENMNAFMEGIIGSGSVVNVNEDDELDAVNSKTSIVYYYKNGERKLTFLNTLVLVKDKMIVIQGIFTSSSFAQFFPIFTKIFDSIEIIDAKPGRAVKIISKGSFKNESDEIVKIVMKDDYKMETGTITRVSSVPLDKYTKGFNLSTFSGSDSDLDRALTEYRNRNIEKEAIRNVSFIVIGILVLVVFVKVFNNKSK